MSDTENNDGGLPPKLNLSKKISKPAGSPALNIKPAGGDAAAKPTGGIKLTPKAGSPAVQGAPKPEGAAPKPLTITSKPAAGTIKPGGGIKLTPKAKPEDSPATAASSNEATGPTTVKPSGIKITPAGAKPATPGGPSTVRLKARPKLKTAGAKPTAPTVAPAKSAEPQAAPAAATEPKVVKLRPKAGVGIKRNKVDLSAPAGSKRATSKISLDAAKESGPIPTESVNTKTIKIKPSSDIKTLSGKIPMTVKQQRAGGPAVPDPKRQTSRISLDAALGTTDEISADTSSGTPKTIRLKRPAKSPTVTPKSSADDAKKEIGKTSKIELPEESEVPATQKKTIKVKRPSQRRTAKKLSVKRGGGGAAAAAEAVAASETPAVAEDSGIPVAPLSSLAPVQAPDRVHWFFVVTSVAATLIIGVLIYVLSAQDFGPNISLTELSYGAPSVDLPWPGKISNVQ